MKKICTTLIAALSSTQAKAAAASGAAGVLGANITQADPWPWAVSALGALVVIVKFPAVTRLHGMTNAVISVLIGGLGSSFAAELIAQRIGIEPGQLLCAFLLSAMWPAGVTAAQQLWPSIRKRTKRSIEGDK